MRCGNCFHARLDHESGRCINRTDRLHAATGVSVVNVCGCKRYVDEVKAPSPRKTATAVVPEPAGENEYDLEQETEPDPDSEAEPPPIGTRKRMEA